MFGLPRCSSPSSHTHPSDSKEADRVARACFAGGCTDPRASAVGFATSRAPSWDSPIWLSCRNQLWFGWRTIGEPYPLPSLGWSTYELASRISQIAASLSVPRLALGLYELAKILDSQSLNWTRRIFWNRRLARSLSRFYDPRPADSPSFDRNSSLRYPSPSWIASK